MLKIKSKYKKKKPTEQEPEATKVDEETAKEAADVADDIDLLDFGETPSPPAEPKKSKAKSEKEPINLLENDTTPDEDPLGDLIGGGPAPAETSNNLLDTDDAPSTNTGHQSALDSALDDVFGTTSSPAPAPAPVPPQPTGPQCWSG